MSPVAALSSIQDQLDKLGRADTKIIVVTKTHGPEIIDTLLQSGHRDFGENRFQEARAKFALVAKAQTKPVYHHIGPLQSGFARNLPGLFQYVHGVSSLSALQVLHKAAQKHFSQTQNPTKYLMQLNLTGETSKLGGMTKQQFEDCLPQLANDDSLQWVGFMTIGPTDQNLQKTREVFQQLRKIKDEFLPDGELSMGMSADWQIAVDEGATMIRIGTAITGSRKGAPWSAESG